MDEHWTLAELARTRARLAELGYQKSERVQGWSECLIERGSERWLGRGRDAESAFADALAQILPSHAARSAWLQEPIVVLPAPAPTSTQASAPTPAPAPAPVRAPLAPAATAPRSVAVSALALATPPVARIALPARPELGFVEADMELEFLGVEIDELEPEAALWCEERQFLLLFLWSSAARSVKERSGQDPRVVQRADSIVRRVTALSKRWWPGLVPALDHRAQASDCAAQFRLEEARPNWGSISNAADRELEICMQRDEQLGIGETGWADDACLEPELADPEHAQAELVRGLESFGGPIDRTPDPASSPELERIARDEGQHLREIALRLRWLRASTVDPRTWGTAMGRLRFLRDRVSAARSVLANTIDPRYRPEKSWAAALGLDPDTLARRSALAALLERLPADTQNESEPARIEWLRQAFELEDGLPNEQIAVRVTPHAGWPEWIATLDPDLLEGFERKHKRRLRKLQQLLADQRRSPPVNPLPPASELVPDQTPMASTRTSMEEGWLAELLPLTRGKRALFISNRNDPQINATLLATFAFAELDHCEGTSSRMQAAAERVANGSYAWVLSATGFQPHKWDGLLKQACQSAGLRYVRVNRGRRLACIRAMARECGLSQETRALRRT